MNPEPTSDGRWTASAPGSPLRCLEALAREAGATDLAREAAALAERVSEGRFYVAVVGQFKRGKSTLINALVGDTLLPAGVVPVTAVVTVVRHGPDRAARIRGVDGAWRDVALGQLADYVSQDANPENAKGVAGVEVFAPSPLLASGMCLVDTPGLGSVFTGGAEATRAFVPHIDAAVVVLGADPPISEDELALVEEASRQVQTLVVVLNKADRVSDIERREAKAFTARILTGRLGRDVGPILEVSAFERLASGTSSRDWEALHDTLARLAREAGSTLVEAAERRGLALLGERLRREIDEAREALVRPVAESEQRIETLRRCASDAERAMRELGYLLTAEQDRLGRRFAERKDEFVSRTVADARRDLSAGARTLDGRGPSLRRRVVSLAQEISRRWLDRWRTEAQPAAEALYRDAAQRFVELANQFLERLAASGDPGLAGLATNIGPELGFRVKSRVHYTELWRLTSQSPVAWLVDLFRSREAMLRAIDRTGGDYLESLLYTNATRIENDFNDRVLDSRRLLESEIRARLTEVYASAERALERARATRAAGAPAVTEEIERLDALRRRGLAMTTRGAQGDHAS
jgi:GTP-binding protein EngB required for normal cell division